MKSVEFPNINEVINPILDVDITFNNKTSIINDLKNSYLRYIDEDRKLPKIQIFNIFASALLERSMK